MRKAASRTEYVFAGVAMRCVLTGTDTAGAFCFFENKSAGCTQTPVHIHSREDETLFVLEGEMCAIVDGKPRAVRPGDAVFLPRGIPHQLKNESGAPARYIILCTPSGFEDFVATAGHVKAKAENAGPPNATEIERMRETAPRFGVEILRFFPK